MKKISKKNFVYAMSSENQPALKVEPGSVVEFETYDCFKNQLISENQSREDLDGDEINPATGPLYITGAGAGDTLKVEIQKIEVGDQGVMVAIPGQGLLGERVEKSEIKVIPIEEGKLRFNNDIQLPLDPMVGVIGVAPAGEAISCGTPGFHGGNMDNRKIKEGTTLYLPIFTKGALLAMGDLHASMGDGEIMCSGVEIPGKIQVKVDLIKGKKINNPILTDKDYYYTIASHVDLSEAIHIATEEMAELVAEKLDLSIIEAGMLLSAIGNIEICQLVDPLLTVRFAFPRNIIDK